MENMGRPTFVYRREMKNLGKSTGTENKKNLFLWLVIITMAKISLDLLRMNQCCTYVFAIVCTVQLILPIDLFDQIDLVEQQIEIIDQIDRVY